MVEVESQCGNSREGQRDQLCSYRGIYGHEPRRMQPLPTVGLTSRMVSISQHQWIEIEMVWRAQ